MVKRKVTILDLAAEEAAGIAYFIESKGLPQTAKRFIHDLFMFFDSLSNPVVIHRPCSYLPWQEAGYRCATFRKKYLVAYLDLEDEIIISDFALHKLEHRR